MSRLPALLIVGAFPSPHSRRSTVIGGVLRSCTLLLQSSLPRKARLTLVDSTQVSVPPPGLAVRLLIAAKRSAAFLCRFERSGREAALIFSSSGASFLEKSLYAWYAHLRGARVLFFMRDGGFMVQVRRSPAYGRFARRLLGANDVILCQSETWRRFFVDEVGMPADHCAIVENWSVRAEDLAVGQARSYRRPGPVTFLYMGWLEESKGVLDLLSAFEALIETCGSGQVRLVLAGEGSRRERCLRWAQERQLEASVAIPGWVSGEARTRLLAGADIFVLPSHFEGLSNAMLEAMAAGLPVIASRVGGLPDAVTSEREGILIEPGHRQQLRDAMLRLAQDETLREAFGRAAHRTAARFELERGVDRLLDLVRPAGGEA